MSIGISCLAIMDACVKWLLLRDFSVFQMLAIRGWIITTAMLLLLPYQGGLRSLGSSRIKLHIIRLIFGFITTLSFFLSLKYLPLADTTAIFFCTTFFMTAGSQIFLKEPVGIHRWSAVALGFIGVLVVTSPGAESFHPASILTLVAGASYAVLMLMGRALSRTDSSFNIVLYMNVMNMFIASVITPFFWRTPTSEEIAMIFLISALALAGFFMITRAFTIASLSIIAPFEYIALIWATLLGYLTWQEIPSLSAWFGMALILAAGLYILWRESRHHSAKDNDDVSA